MEGNQIDPDCVLLLKYLQLPQTGTILSIPRVS